MLVVANYGKYKMMQETWKMIKTLANGYSSESTQLELSNEYQLQYCLDFLANSGIFPGKILAFLW